MSNLDLNKKIGGKPVSQWIQEMMESGTISFGQIHPVDEKLIGRLASIDLEGRSRTELKKLLAWALNLMTNVEYVEPDDKESKEYKHWDKLITKACVFYSRVHDALEAPEEG